MKWISIKKCFLWISMSFCCVIAPLWVYLLMFVLIRYCFVIVTMVLVRWLRMNYSRQSDIFSQHASMIMAANWCGYCKKKKSSDHELLARHRHIFVVTAKLTSLYRANVDWLSSARWIFGGHFFSTFVWWSFRWTTSSVKLSKWTCFMYVQNYIINKKY